MRYRVEDELRFIELSARLSLARAGDPRTDGDLEKCEVRSETLLRKLSPSAIVRPGEALFTHDGASSIDMKRGRRSSVGPESIGDEVQLGELGLVVAG